MRSSLKQIIFQSIEEDFTNKWDQSTLENTWSGNFCSETEESGLWHVEIHVTVFDCIHFGLPLTSDAFDFSVLPDQTTSCHPSFFCCPWWCLLVQAFHQISWCVCGEVELALSNDLLVHLLLCAKNPHQLNGNCPKYYGFVLFPLARFFQVVNGPDHCSDFALCIQYIHWYASLYRKAHWKYVVLVGLAVVIRPTAAIMWLPLILWHLYMYKHVFWKVVRLLVEKGWVLLHSDFFLSAITILVMKACFSSRFLILTLSSIVDRAFYGKWTYVQLNFLEFNVFSGLGSFYGSHPWHWYLTQGLAVILGVQLFPFVLALRKGMQPTFVKIIAWTVAVYRYAVNALD